MDKEGNAATPPLRKNKDGKDGRFSFVLFSRLLKDTYQCHLIPLYKYISIYQY